MQPNRQRGCRGPTETAGDLIAAADAATGTAQDSDRDRVILFPFGEGRKTGRHGSISARINYSASSSQTATVGTLPDAGFHGKAERIITPDLRQQR